MTSQHATLRNSILAALAAAGATMSGSDIIRATGGKRDACNALLRDMERRDVVRRVGSVPTRGRPAAIWELTGAVRGTGGPAVKTVDQAGVPWLRRMSPERERVLTEEMVDLKWGTEVKVASEHVARLEADLERRRAELEIAEFGRDFYSERVGRSIASIRADIAAARDVAQRELEAAQAQLNAIDERVRDYEGYQRVLRERHPELADAECAEL